jgi:leucyl/phenylalanyl-tRNA--protein transferase
LGNAASVEVIRKENGQLVGGIYGVHIGGAFFGESMFSRVSGAGRVAFDHLRRQLVAKGFVLFDTQYINPHTRLLGAIEIPRSEFRRKLSAALSLHIAFAPDPFPPVEQ